MLAVPVLLAPDDSVPVEVGAPAPVELLLPDAPVPVGEAPDLVPVSEPLPTPPGP